MWYQLVTYGCASDWVGDALVDDLENTCAPVVGVEGSLFLDVLCFGDVADTTFVVRVIYGHRVGFLD